MPHHWYAIANAQADAQRERTQSALQMNTTQSNVVNMLRDFRQMVKHCDDITFDWRDGTKVRRYRKKSFNNYINQLESQVIGPR